MTRVFSQPGASDQPCIESQKVAAFFESRAKRLAELGPTRAVIYQDNNPALAEQRDAVEIAKLLPMLKLDGGQKILDVGCGTGRWASRLLPHVAAYHGIDLCAGLLEHAKSAFAGVRGCRFSVLSADNISFSSLGDSDFDRVVCAGVCVYLNDDQLHRMFDGIAEVAAPCGYVLLREPVALEERLTLSDHYSNELNETYHAVYRTERELVDAMAPSLFKTGFTVVGRGDVFEDPDLNNRVETKQRWLLLARGK